MSAWPWAASTDQATEDKAAWRNLLSKWYAESADSGTHGAAGWALRRWEMPLAAG